MNQRRCLQCVTQSFGLEMVFGQAPEFAIDDRGQSLNREFVAQTSCPSGLRDLSGILHGANYKALMSPFSLIVFLTRIRYPLP